MNKIFLLEPYEGLFTDTTSNKSILKEVISLDDVNAKALEFQANGGEIIVTRGGSAEKLKKILDIPIVEIKVTTGDILKIFQKFKGTKVPLGVVGYSSVIENCKWVAECLDIDIKIILIDEYTKKEKILSEIYTYLHVYGIRNFIGDTVLLNLMQEQQLPVNFELIKSNKESIDEALEKAIEILKIKEAEKEKSRTLTILFNHIDMGVIYLDDSYRIIHSNIFAEKYFLEKDFFKEMLKRNLDGENGGNRVINIKDKEFLLNIIPIVVNEEVKGTVITFSETKNIKKAIKDDFVKKGLLSKHEFSDFVSINSQMKNLKSVAKNYAQTDATILITGESGTGKEILAQSIHSESNRKNGPFVALNCASIPAQLLESELFGYEPGAFTGASKNGKIGMFELADRGTIFLDEIGELTLELQTKLLRVIQEGEFRKIGSDEIKKTDFRIIAATNVNFLKLVKEKKFRADLYYRLNVLRLETIPLRERKEDIPFLIDFFLKSTGKKIGKYLEKFEQELIEYLVRYDWPGNVRELKNIVQRIGILSKTEIGKLEEVKIFLGDLKDEDEIIDEKQYSDFLQGDLEGIKKKVVNLIFEEEEKNKSRTAKRLGIDRGTLERILKL